MGALLLLQANFDSGAYPPYPPRTVPIACREMRENSDDEQEESKILTWILPTPVRMEGVTEARRQSVDMADYRETVEYFYFAPPADPYMHGGGLDAMRTRRPGRPRLRIVAQQQSMCVHCTEYTERRGYTTCGDLQWSLAPPARLMIEKSATSGRRPLIGKGKGIACGILGLLTLFQR